MADDDPDGEPCDGLAVHTGPTVFDSGQDEPEAVTCPRCRTTTDLSDEGEEEDEGRVSGPASRRRSPTGRTPGTPT